MPISKNLFSVKDICCELGEVIAGKKKARAKDSDITVFDSTGLAIQDVATANLVYQKGVEGKYGNKIAQVLIHTSDFSIDEPSGYQMDFNFSFIIFLLSSTNSKKCSNS